MENYFGQTPSIYTNAENGKTTVTIYSRAKPDWDSVTRKHVAAALRRIARCGIVLGRPGISLAKLKPQDYAESWKRHFKPIEIGSALLIKPSWCRRKPKNRQAVVVLDPGLSFGTGQHPTTAFCLRQLVAHRKPSEAQAFLDIGTGSGILSIAAAKLGYEPVEAWDSDPESIRVARANLRNNRVSRRVRLRQKDVTKLSARSRDKYSVICANLISNLLVEERNQILARLQAHGVLVLAGILEREFPQVQTVYEAAGLRLIASRTQREWRSGSFRCLFL